MMMMMVMMLSCPICPPRKKSSVFKDDSFQCLPGQNDISGCSDDRGYPRRCFPGVESSSQSPHWRLRLPLRALFCKVPGHFDFWVNMLSSSLVFCAAFHFETPDLLADDVVWELLVVFVEPHPHGQHEQDPRRTCSCHPRPLLLARGQYNLDMKKIVKPKKHKIFL